MTDQRHPTPARFKTFLLWIGLTLGVLSLSLIGGFLALNHWANTVARVPPPTTQAADLQTVMAEYVAAMPPDKTAELTELTNFGWEKLCLFGGYTPADHINQTLGFTWLHQLPGWVPVIGGVQYYVQENHTLMVFVADQEVVAHVEVPESLVPLGPNQCVSDIESTFYAAEFYPGEKALKFVKNQLR